MNRALAKIVKVTIPFNGTPAELAKNQASHVWRVIDMEERYGTRGIPRATECQRCKVLAESVASDWPCGQAPTPLSLGEYKYMLSRKKRHKG